MNAFTGISPKKRQEDLRLFIDDDDGDGIYIKYSVPYLDMYDTQVANIRVEVDSHEVHLDMIEEMDIVAAEVFEAKRPVIAARAIARSTAKAVGTSLLSEAVEDKKWYVQLLVDIFGFLFTEVTEKADVRSWQTLPGQSWVQVMKLPEGEHTIYIQYLDEFDRVLMEEEQRVTITPDTELELLESIYSI